MTTETYWLKDNEGNLVFAAVLFEAIEKTWEDKALAVWRLQWCDGNCGEGDFLTEECLTVSNGGTGLCCVWGTERERDVRALFAVLKTSEGRARWITEWRLKPYYSWPTGDIHKYLAEHEGANS